MHWWHCTIAAPNRETRFMDPAARLAAVRAVARAGGGAVLLFCVVDDHVHLVLAGTREAVGRIMGAISQALTKGAQLGSFEPARYKPVDGRPHLETLVSYVLCQTQRHDLGIEPATWDGSCLADLLGARLLPGFDRRSLAAALPRRDVARMALGAVGLGWEELAEVPVGDAASLWRASCAAVGVTRLDRNLPREVAARGAFVQLARSAGLEGAREAAGLPTPTWYRLAKRAPDPDLQEAIRRRLALDARAAEAVSRRSAA